MWITQGRAYSGKIECEQAERKQRKNIVKSFVGETGLLVVLLHYSLEQAPYYLRDYDEPIRAGTRDWNITCLAEQSNSPGQPDST